MLSGAHSAHLIAQHFMLKLDDSRSDLQHRQREGQRVSKQYRQRGIIVSRELPHGQKSLTGHCGADGRAWGLMIGQKEHRDRPLENNGVGAHREDGLPKTAQEAQVFRVWPASDIVCSDC
eukprot:1156585-Pelagomonas_calceolata.AAC.5